MKKLWCRFEKKKKKKIWTIYHEIDILEKQDSFYTVLCKINF